MALSRDDVVRTARTWIGTPYHHQASVRSVGTDCLGLVRGVWRDLYGRDAEMPPPYTRDWAEASGQETLLDAARLHLVARDAASIAPGDVLVFRLRGGLPAKHCAILAIEGTMIHAMERCPVAEVAFSNWWRRRLAGVFSFPGITD
jgi:NlpC/P60 family putative phage cell wall peptidase